MQNRRRKHGSKFTASGLLQTEGSSKITTPPVETHTPSQPNVFRPFADVAPSVASQAVLPSRRIDETIVMVQPMVKRNVIDMARVAPDSVLRPNHVRLGSGVRWGVSGVGSGAGRRCL